MPVEFKDYYAILGVKKNASPEEIKQTYRRLAHQHHPDVHPEKTRAQAAEKFKEINEAYQVLSDPEKKVRYDQLGPGWEGAAQHRTTGEGADFSGFSDFFEEIFGAGGRHGFGVEDVLRGRSPKGQDIEAEMPLTLEEAFHGGDKRISLRLPFVCPRCAGTGRISRRACASCGGSGEIEKERTITAHLPKHIVDGTKLRLRGQGAAGGDGEAGDLFLRIKLLPHSVFKISGSDLETFISVMPWDAALGSEALVPTLEGPIRIKVPPGTRTNRPLRIAGKGLAKEGGARGDLYAIVRIDNPDRLDDRLLRKFEQIKECHKRIS